MEKQLNGVMEASILETLAQIRKLGTEDLLRIVLREIRKVLGVERVSIFKVSNELDEFYIVMGEPEGKHGIGQRFPFDSQKHLKRAVETKSWSEELDPGQNPEMWRLKELVYNEGITDIVAFPVIIENEVKWLVVIDAKYPRQEFSKEETLYCKVMTDLAGFSLERDLMQKEQAEKESLVTISKVAGEAVHKLRNPIQYIHGSAKWLLKEIGDSPLVPWTVKDYAERIFSGALNLEETFNSLVRFSRPKKANVIRVDINEVIRNLSERLIGEGEDFKFGFNLDPNLPSITADLSDIEEMISPILCNAVEAIKKGGEIRIRTKCERENERIRISISNSGGCISDEIIEEIFDPFFTTKPDGTGLGLATAMITARAYNGEIKVENDKSLNLTTFIVKLPTNLIAERG